MPINSTQNISFKGGFTPIDSLAGQVSNRLPNVELKNDKLIKCLTSAAKNITSADQRLIMGITAIFSQPFFDYNNKHVNEDTRLTSTCRTVAKIVVGTTVGVLVRKGCIRLIRDFSQVVRFNKLEPEKYFAKKAKKFSLFSPSYIRNFTQEQHDNYIKTMGTVLAVIISIFTNVLIDAPLTQIITNTLYKKVQGGKNDLN